MVRLAGCGGFRKRNRCLIPMSRRPSEGILGPIRMNRRLSMLCRALSNGALTLFAGQCGVWVIRSDDARHENGALSLSTR